MKSGRIFALVLCWSMAGSPAWAEVEWEGQTIREDGQDTSGKWDAGMYIVPNEKFPDAWQPVLQGKRGAYVGVGTFRMLNTAAYNDFSHIFLMDIDSTTADFNRINLELVRHAPTRREYLSLLFARDLGSVNLSDLNNWDGMDYWKTLPVLNEEIWQKNLPSSLHESYQKYLDGKRVHKHFGDWERIAGKYSRKNWITTSDKIYAQLRKQVLENRFTVLNGDLSGSQTMKDLGEALRKKGIGITALDTSNALDYVLGRGGKSAAENIRSLPFAPDGKILLTSEFLPGGSRKDNWDYQIRSPQEVSDALAATEGDKDAMGSFQKRLATQPTSRTKRGLLVSEDPCLGPLKRTLLPSFKF